METGVRGENVMNPDRRETGDQRGQSQLLDRRMVSSPDMLSAATGDRFSRRPTPRRTPKPQMSYFCLAFDCFQFNLSGKICLLQNRIREYIAGVEVNTNPSRGAAAEVISLARGCR